MDQWTRIRIEKLVVKYLLELHYQKRLFSHWRQRPILFWMMIHWRSKVMHSKCLQLESNTSNDSCILFKMFISWIWQNGRGVQFNINSTIHPTLLHHLRRINRMQSISNEKSIWPTDDVHPPSLPLPHSPFELNCHCVHCSLSKTSK